MVNGKPEWCYYPPPFTQTLDAKPQSIGIFKKGRLR